MKIPQLCAMPLVQNILSRKARVGLWRIDGTEEAQYAEVFTEPENRKIHPRKSLQRKASRLLLAEMLGFLPGLEKDETGRPILKNSPLQVSISHTDGYAAIMLGDARVAIDVQAISPRILKLRERYLKENEQRMAHNADMATLLWAAKETVYKFRATEKHDFRAPISIHHILEDTISTSLRVGTTLISMNLGYRWLSGAVLVWLDEVTDSQ